MYIKRYYMVFNEINSIKGYFLNDKEIECDQGIKFFLELYRSGKLSNFTLKSLKFDKTVQY